MGVKYCYVIKPLLQNHRLMNKLLDMCAIHVLARESSPEAFSPNPGFGAGKICSGLANPGSGLKKQNPGLNPGFFGAGISNICRLYSSEIGKLVCIQ